MLLYIHVPFCRSKCRYCAFASEVFTMDGVEAWQRALAAEAAHWGKMLGKPAVETVYIGGGTPSLLPGWAFEGLMRTLRKAFVLPKDIEFTMEANPDSATDKDLLKLWRGMGVNRLSLGVQSFVESDLELLGRPHGAAQVLTAVERARAAGFSNLSMDLIWGLPGTRLKTWTDNLKAVVRMNPEHISCYGLTLEPGTPLAKASEVADINLPGEDEQARMYVYGGEYLEEQGYMHYEISNFARMGYASLHNQGYWEGKDYLGLGPSAVSTIEGRRWENPKTVKDYVELSGRKAWGWEAEVLTPEIRTRELLMLALRTSKGMKIADYNLRTGRNLMAEQGKLLGAMRQKELIRIKDGNLRLTRQGMLVSNLIITRLLFPEP